MQERIYVIPVGGKLVPDPAVKGTSVQVRLPAEGKLVLRNSYWDRRRIQGDVIFGKPPKSETKPEPKTALRAKDGDQ